MLTGILNSIDFWLRSAMPSTPLRNASRIVTQSTFLRLGGEQMHTSKARILLSFALATAIAQMIAPAMAGLHINRGYNVGKGCGQLVTVKHPDLKGPPRKKEWDRCMADPDGYGKI
jgi:hypothetical protein